MKAYRKDVLHAFIEGQPSVYYEVKISQDMQKEMKDKLQKLIDSRKKWPHVMYEFIASRMKLQFPKTEEFSPDMLAGQDEILIALCDEFKKMIELREKPMQKDLKDDLKQRRK